MTNKKPGQSNVLNTLAKTIGTVAAAAIIALSPAPSLPAQAVSSQNQPISIQQTVVNTLNKAKGLEQILIDSSVYVMSLAPYGDNYVKMSIVYSTPGQTHENILQKKFNTHLMSIVFDSTLQTVYAAVCNHPNGMEQPYIMNGLMNYFGGSSYQYAKGKFTDGFYNTVKPTDNTLIWTDYEQGISRTYQKTGKKATDLSNLREIGEITQKDNQGPAVYGYMVGFSTKKGIPPVSQIEYNQIYLLNDTADFVEWKLVEASGGAILKPTGLASTIIVSTIP